MPYVIRFVLIVVGVLALLFILFNSYTIGPPDGYVEKRSFSEIVNQLNELNSVTKTRAGSSVVNPQSNAGTINNEGEPQHNAGTSTSDVSPRGNASTSSNEGDPLHSAGQTTNDGNPRADAATSRNDVNPRTNAGTSANVKSQKKAGARDSNK